MDRRQPRNYADDGLRNIAMALIDLAALGVKWLREPHLRVVSDSGAQLLHHAGKMVAGTAHSDWVHSRYGLVDHADFQPKTPLTIVNPHSTHRP